MKVKYFKILIIIFLLFNVTGCVKTFKHENAIYTKNILCQPEKMETIKIYEQEEIDINSLKACSEFQVFTDDYEGLWTTFFVKPLAFILINVGKLLNSFGFAIILVTILLRFLFLPVSAKTTLQSRNMNQAKPDIDRLNKKYENKTDRDSLMKKSQEQLLIYKKYNIKPLSGCLFAIIQIPLFFAFFEALNRVPVLFEENFLNLFELGKSPLFALKAGQYYYIIFIILIIGTTYLSFKLNKTPAMSEEQEKSMKMTMNIMIIVISFASFTLTTGIGLYWITNSTFTIIQGLVMKRGFKNVN